MRTAIYAQDSTSHQARKQSIDQPVERLKTHAQREGWTLEAEHVCLDPLHDVAAMAEFDGVLIAAPDQPARKQRLSDIII
jgi:hypothetical protein